MSTEGGGNEKGGLWNFLQNVTSRLPGPAPIQAQAGVGKAQIKDVINEYINKERVVIFSKSYCPYCVEAKKVFTELGQTYSTVELTEYSNPTEVQEVLKDMTGVGTVPRIFVDGVCIGGLTDTKKLCKDGKLTEILKKPSTSSLRGKKDTGKPKAKKKLW